MRVNIDKYILQETKWWLALNKPAGLIVERNPYENPTIEDLVINYLTDKERRCSLGIVHRLDRVTSGVLIMAKRKAALRHLNRQFAERRVQKVYWAVVQQAPPAASGRLHHWLEKDQRGKRAIIYPEAHPRAQEVSLHYRVFRQDPGRIWLEVVPETGKFHQIRAQLAAAGCPILGDEKYGAAVEPGAREIALHARSLSFRDPQTEVELCLEAPVPQRSIWEIDR